MERVLDAEEVRMVVPSGDLDDCLVLLGRLWG